MGKKIINTKNKKQVVCRVVPPLVHHPSFWQSAAEGPPELRAGFGLWPLAALLELPIVSVLTPVHFFSVHDDKCHNYLSE